jgi:class 3 adenylate cyclase/predicted ATPase
VAPDIEQWLEGLGLEQYAKTFADNAIDWEVLPDLTDRDLEALGVLLGHRKKLLKAIALLSGEAKAPSAPPTALVSDRRPDSYTPVHLARRILDTRSAIEGERKQVTVLFADIKGSLELIESSDPEQTHKLLDSTIQTMMDAVHRYEGTVNKVLGDGIMALFGAPLAHEDHAVRACYAALAMQETIQRDAEEVRRRYGVELQIRVGLNSGEVVVRAIGNDLTMDYDAIGQTTHLAGRMEQLAIPGTARLTSDTLRLVEGFVEVRSLGPVPIKGLESPVEVFELTGATSTRTRFQAAVARGLTRFVGRDTELETLTRARSRAGEGQGQIVGVVGEPGVGKSRLFYEFVHSHRTEGWLILESGSVSYGKATAYLPLIDLLKSYFRIETRDDVRRIREKVTGKLLTLDESLKPMLIPLLALLDVPVEDAAWEALDPSQRRQRTLDATRSLLLRESRVQPLILIFEDLHWIDSETQTFLDSLVESLPTARFLLLVNYRPEYRHAWGGKTYYTQRRIDPLPPESAEELLAGLLGDDAGLGPLKRMLIVRTGGNPFFLEESIRTLIEVEALTGTPGAYRVTKGVEVVQVPATVQGVLAARIDRLAVEDKQLLQTSAVIGKDVPYALVQAIADLPEEALRHRLANLQAAEFIYETRLFPDLEYTFKHALTHEVAYSSLLQQRRQAFHRRIAEAIESIYAVRLAEQSERLAHHYTEAGLTEPAVGYWEQAGTRAIERSANAEAVVHLTKGLELLGTLPETPERIHQEIRIELALGVALMATKGFAASEVEQTYIRARELCERVGRTPELFRVLRGQGEFYIFRGPLDKARELGIECLDLAEELGDPGLELMAHHLLWNSLFLMGQFAAGKVHADEGFAIYDPERYRSYIHPSGHDPGISCRHWRSWVLWLRGYPEQALESARETLTLAETIGHPHSLALALYCTAMVRLCRREAGEAQDQAEAEISLSNDQGFQLFLARGKLQRGAALIQHDAIEDGIEEMREGLESYRALQAKQGIPYWLGLLGDALGVVGRVAEGLTTVTEALGLTDQTGERMHLAELYRIKGTLLRNESATPLQEAEECFLKGIEVAREQGARSLELRAATSLARLWHEQGKTGQAQGLLTPIYGWFTEGFETEDLKEAKVLLEDLA